MSEIVKCWIENFNSNNILVKNEIEEVKIAINNEEIWLNGSNKEESKQQHLQNIKDLKEYLKWLQDQN